MILASELDLVQMICEQSARVAICARNEAVLAATAQELGGSGEVHHRRADLAVADAPAEFVDWAAERLGGLDVVVSNVSAQAGSDFTASFQVDIVAANSLIRAALVHLPDHAGASIVCIGSRAANVGVPWMPACAAMMAATVSMVKSVALDVARRGIRANAPKHRPRSFKWHAES